jgi:ubiquitin C-terminal hydrolase
MPVSCFLAKTESLKSGARETSKELEEENQNYFKSRKNKKNVKKRRRFKDIIMNYLLEVFFAETAIIFLLYYLGEKGSNDGNSKKNESTGEKVFQSFVSNQSFVSKCSVPKTKINLTDKAFEPEWLNQALGNYYENPMGISNDTGSDCYLNSLIQFLIRNRKLVKQIQLLALELKNRNKNYQKTITWNLFLVFYLMLEKSQNNPGKSINFTSFEKNPKMTIRNRLFGSGQQDSHEMIIRAFDLIREETKNFTKDIVNKNLFFEGNILIESIIVPKEGENRNPVSKKEKVGLLTLGLNNASSIEKAIENFSCVEHLTGDNKYCLENGAKVDVDLTSKIINLPKNLYIHLKRFRYSEEKKSSYKINSCLEFPKELKIKTDDKENLYGLIGVIIHSGNLHGGHYWAHFHDEKNNWHCLNDSSASSCSFDQVKSDGFGSDKNTKSAYILYYERIN